MLEICNLFSCSRVFPLNKHSIMEATMTLFWAPIRDKNIFFFFIVSFSLYKLFAINIARLNIRHPVEFEFQINNESLEYVSNKAWDMKLNDTLFI